MVSRVLSFARAGAVTAVLVAQAFAAQAITVAQSFEVQTSVTQVGSNWQYEYTVTNTSAGVSGLNKFAVPYFGDYFDASAFVSGPSGWTNSIVTSFAGTPLDQWAYSAGVTQAIQWSTTETPLSSGDSVSGFTFVSSYGPVKGPSYAGFFGGGSGVIDPGIPGSPLAQAAGFTEPFASPVPEPGAPLLALAGTMALAFVRWRSRRRC